MKSFNEWLFSRKVKTHLNPEDITRIARGVLLQNREELDEFGHLDDYSKKRVRDEMEKGQGRQKQQQNMPSAQGNRLQKLEPTGQQKDREPSFYEKQQEREKEYRRRAYNNPPSAQSGFPSYSGPG